MLSEKPELEEGEERQDTSPHCPIHPEVELNVFLYEGDASTNDDNDGPNEDEPWHFVKCPEKDCFCVAV